MRCADYIAIGLIGCAAGSLCQAQPSAYIERWATGTLTTGETFESWRIHIIVPDGDDWLGSGVDAWLSGGPVWYYNFLAGSIPDPGQFGTYPDAEFNTYWTSPHLYPNSSLLDNEVIIYSADTVREPTFFHQGYWGDQTFDTNGDYVVWQGTVINPADGAYGTIEFSYVTQLEPYNHELTFTIPEPMTALLLAFGACGARGRR